MATLGGVTLPLDYAEDGITRTVIDVGALHELLSGNLGYDYVGDRYHWALRCNHITAAERTSVLGVYRTKTAQTFVDPESVSYSVLVIPNTWRETYIEGGDGTKYFTVDFEIEETTAAAVT